MKHIHIVGTGPRTGTTLMAEAMIVCFRIDQHTDHEDRVFTKPAGPGNIFLTKTVKDIMVARPLLKLRPELYVICMIRDPRDAVVSRHDQDPDVYWAGLRYWKSFIPYWRRARGHPRFITVRYEDLVSDPDGTQEELMERMPFLEKQASFSRYHETAAPSGKSLDALKGVRPIAPDGIAAWREHLPRITGQLQIHGSIADDLIEFGYEPDDKWLTALEGVEPDVSPSHWAEHFWPGGLLLRSLPAYPAIVKAGIKRAFRRRPTRTR